MVVWVLVFAVLLALLFLLKAGSSISRGSLIAEFGVGLAFVVPLHILWPRLLDHLKASGLAPSRRVAVLALGPEEQLQKAALMFEDPRKEIAHAWSTKPLRSRANDDKIAQDVLGKFKEGAFTELLIVASVTHLRNVQAISEALRLAPFRVHLRLDDRLKWMAARTVSDSDAGTVIELSREPLGLFERMLKRGFDIAFSGAALLCLAPILVLIALAIRLDSPGPALFRQRREGFGNEPFRIFKFRTMRVMEDGGTIIQARAGDDRVTRIGRFLRRTSIDELPQLLNILVGDMSVVGPRPHAVAHGEFYSDLIREYAHRHHVKPGLTGWAQVSGHRGETRSVERMRERVQHDLWYIDNWSFFLDIRIILMTIRHVVANPNAI
jgi:Undecaprenyl-phosphate glucose phosphotransferase